MTKAIAKPVSTASLHTFAAKVFTDCGNMSTLEAITAGKLVELLDKLHAAHAPITVAAKAGAAPDGSDWAYYNQLASEKAGSNAVHVRALMGLFFNDKKVASAGGRAVILERLHGRNDNPAKAQNRLADLPRIGKGKEVAKTGAQHGTDKPEGAKAIKGATMPIDGLGLFIAAIKQMEADGCPESLLKKFDGMLTPVQAFYAKGGHLKAA